MKRYMKRLALLVAALLPLAMMAQSYHTVPYTEGFENPDATTHLPTGWVNYQTGSSGAASLFPCCYQHSPNARTGSYYFELESNSGQTELCASPEFADPSALMIDFYLWFLNDYSHTTLEIGIMEDSTFVPLDTVAGSSYTGSYAPYRLYLVDYSGTGHRIGFRATYTGSGTYTVFIDDMTISYAPSCVHMPGAASATVDSNSATLTWGAATVSAGYLLYLNNDSTWYYPTSNSYSFSGLEANTYYSGYIYNTCTGSDTSEARPFGFRTSCGMARFPLLETFEGYDVSFPSCWNVTEASGSYPNIASNVGLGGSNALNMGSNSATVSFASPNLYTPINSLETKFWAKKSSTSYTVYMAVGYVTNLDSIDNAVMLDTFELTADWTEYLTSFGDVATTESGYIVYRKFVSGYNYYAPYIDDITIRPIRACAIPQDFHTTGTASGQMDLAWTDSVASAWQVVYGPVGMNPDTALNNLATFYDTYGTISGLADSVTYDFYVRADCGSEQSYWVGPVSARPNLHVMGANQSDTVHMCGGTISDDGGLDGNYATGQNSLLVLYPSDSTQAVTLRGSIQLYYSTYYTSHFRVYEGVGTDGRQLCDITTDDSVNVVSSVGPLTIQFQSASYYNSIGFELTVGCYDLPTCTDPYDVEVSDIAGGSALVHWQYGTVTPAQDFTITVTDTASGTSTTFVAAASSRSYLVSGLDQTTTYYVTVAANCSSSDVSNSVGAYFTTVCFVGGEIQIGEGTNTSAYVPVALAYSYYALSQTLYTASDLAPIADTIYGVRYFSTSSTTLTRQIDFFVDTTSVSSLGSNDYIVPDSSTLRYSGSFDIASGWNEILFDTPYVRPNNTSNLVFTFFDHTNSYNYSYIYWQTSSVSSRAIYRSSYSSINPYDSQSGMTTTSSLPNMVFVTPCGDASCVAPNVSTGSIDAGSVTLNWVPGMSETQWTVEYKLASDTAWTVVTPSTSNQTETVSGLLPNMEYNFRVGSLCASADEVPYGAISARTTCSVSPRSTLPLSEGFEGYATGDMPNCWIRTATGTSGSGTFPCCYNYGGNARNGSVYFELEADNGGTEIFALPAYDTINGLALDFYVATSSAYAPTAFELGVLVGDTAFEVLDTIDLSDCTSLYSYIKKSVLINYAGTANRIAFRATKTSRYTVFLEDFSLYVPNPCDSVRAITATYVGLDTVTLSWTDTTLTGSYTLRISTTNDEAAVFDSVVTTATSHTFTGLTPATDYYIFVYANCLSGMSDMNMVKVTTACNVIRTYPWSEDFETFTASSTLGSPMEHCWNRGTTSTSIAYPNLNSYYNHTSGGSNSLYLYPYYNCWIALPEMENIDSLILKFYMLGTSSSIQAAVGVMSDQSDISTFVPIDTVTFTENIYEWQRMRVDLSQAPDSCHFICIRTMGSGGGSFYIDDISLNYNNGCAELLNLTTSAVGRSTATINWIDTSASGNYIVSISTVNNIDSAFLTDTVGLTTYSFTGLSGVTTYYVWVANNCPNGTSDLLQGNFTTLAADPHFLPYFNDFEDSTNTFTIYQHVGLNQWHIGTAVNHGGSHSLYVSNDGGTTNAYTNTRKSISFAMTYLQIPYDSSYAISYDWRCQGEGSYDLMRLALVPEDYDFTAAFTAVNRYSNTLPTGWIALDGGKRNLRTTWQHSENNVNLPAGNYYLTLVWINDDAMGSNPPAAIDNISFSIITCPAPANLTATSSSSSTIDVSWDEGAASSWMVEYGVAGFTTGMGTYLLATSGNITLSGLASSTSYDIYVYPICSATDTGFYSKTTCITGCDSVVTVFPWVEDFENGINCWSQSYVRGDVGWTVGHGGNAYGGGIGAATGQYNARFTVNSYSQYVTYLVTPMLSIESPDDVMMTFYHAQPGWGEDQDTLAVYYRVHPDSAWHYLASWHDNIGSWQADTVMLPNTTATYQVGFMGYSGFGLGILLDSVVVYGTETCTRPTFTNSNVGSTSIAVTWNSPASLFDVAIRPTNQPWPEPTRITAHTYTFTGLEPSTRYEYRVRSLCNDTSLSFWSTTNCLTDTLECYVVEGLNVVDVDYQSVTLNWNADASGHSVAYVVSIFNTAFNSSDTVYSNTATISNLNPGVSYGVSVQSVCSATTYSDWSQSVNFTTPICAPVSDVAVSQVTAHSAVVDWVPGGDEASWQVTYGFHGFEQGEGTTITVTTHPVTIDNLDDETDYDVFVRSACTEQVASAWSSVISFSTPTAVGIDQVVDGTFSCTIYPNPTSDEATITLYGVDGNVQIDVLDISGRSVASQTLRCSADCQKSLSVSDLAQGTYFVRVTSNALSLVRKLVVR